MVHKIYNSKKLTIWPAKNGEVPLFLERAIREKRGSKKNIIPSKTDENSYHKFAPIENNKSIISVCVYSCDDCEPIGFLGENKRARESNKIIQKTKQQKIRQFIQARKL